MRSWWAGILASIFHGFLLIWGAKMGRPGGPTKGQRTKSFNQKSDLRAQGAPDRPQTSPRPILNPQTSTRLERNASGGQKWTVKNSTSSFQEWQSASFYRALLTSASVSLESGAHLGLKNNLFDPFALQNSFQDPLQNPPQTCLESCLETQSSSSFKSCLK